MTIISSQIYVLGDDSKKMSFECTLTEKNVFFAFISAVTFFK